MELTPTYSQGEQPVLSGGKLLTGLKWTSTTATAAATATASAGGPVFETTLPSDTLIFDQLFVHGRREIRARYPNGGWTVSG